jgi:hypothetical protein
MEKFEIVSKEQAQVLRAPRKKTQIAQDYENRLSKFYHAAEGSAIKISLNGTGAGTVKARLRRAALTLGIEDYKIKQKGSVIVFWIDTQKQEPEDGLHDM